MSILNIQNIILTGNMTTFGETWLQAVQEAVSKTAFSKMAQQTQISLGNSELRCCILGASASMLLNNYSLLFTNSNN